MVEQTRNQTSKRVCIPEMRWQREILVGTGVTAGSRRGHGGIGIKTGKRPTPPIPLLYDRERRIDRFLPPSKRAGMASTVDGLHSEQVLCLVPTKRAGMASTRDRGSLYRRATVPERCTRAYRRYSGYCTRALCFVTLRGMAAPAAPA